MSSGFLCWKRRLQSCTAGAWVRASRPALHVAATAVLDRGGWGLRLEGRVLSRVALCTPGHDVPVHVLAAHTKASGILLVRHHSHFCTVTFPVDVVYAVNARHVLAVMTPWWPCSYHALDGGSTTQALVDITGGCGEVRGVAMQRLRVYNQAAGGEAKSTQHGERRGIDSERERRAPEG